MSDSLLYTPYRLGRIELANRVVMAPMTRSRSIGNVPGELVAEYYSQRTEAGLIITEGTSPAADGLGYARIPGLFNAEQAGGWKRVTERVHAGGSRIFLQLMHTGRVSHPANLPAGTRILAPSAIAAPGEMFTDAQGMQKFPTPIALTEADIETVLQQFENSAQLAIDAGFDGIELHGANGYLIEQFLNVASNQRTDQWGGSVDNRARFALAVAGRVSRKIGADRVGIRVSPYGVFNGSVSDPETDALYVKLAQELSKLGIAYVHTVDHSSMGAPKPSQDLYRQLRSTFKGTLIASGGYDAARAEADLREKKADLVAFGRPFLSNPRLVSKLKSGAKLAQPNEGTFYTPGPVGYTDYPVD